MNYLKGLSPRMQAAMGAIAEGYVTYELRPDSLATFSHGLRRDTVQALADRVRLIASDMSSGWVVAVRCGHADPRRDQHCGLLAEHGGPWHEARLEPGYVGDCWPTDPELLARYAAGEAI
jgi:hypothetical protein